MPPTMMTSTSEGSDMFWIISVRAEDKLSLARGTFVDVLEAFEWELHVKIGFCPASEIRFHD